MNVQEAFALFNRLDIAQEAARQASMTANVGAMIEAMREVDAAEEQFLAHLAEIRRFFPVIIRLDFALFLPWSACVYRKPQEREPLVSRETAVKLAQQWTRAAQTTDLARIAGSPDDEAETLELVESIVLNCLEDIRHYFPVGLSAVALYDRLALEAANAPEQAMAEREAERDA